MAKRNVFKKNYKPEGATVALLGVTGEVGENLLDMLLINDEARKNIKKLVLYARPSGNPEEAPESFFANRAKASVYDLKGLTDSNKIEVVAVNRLEDVRTHRPDYIINCAGESLTAPEMNGGANLNLLAGTGIELTRTLAQIATRDEHGNLLPPEQIPFIINLTNPLGPNTQTLSALGVPADKILGVSGDVDSKRYSTQINVILGIDASYIQTRSYGQHAGKKMVLRALIDGQPFHNWLVTELKDASSLLHLYANLKHFANILQDIQDGHPNRTAKELAVFLNKILRNWDQEAAANPEALAKKIELFVQDCTACFGNLMVRAFREEGPNFLAAHEALRMFTALESGKSEEPLNCHAWVTNNYAKDGDAQQAFASVDVAIIGKRQFQATLPQVPFDAEETIKFNKGVTQDATISACMEILTKLPEKRDALRIRTLKQLQEMASSLEISPTARIALGNVSESIFNQVLKPIMDVFSTGKFPRSSGLSQAA